ncbi:MAG: 50S ribosomal protein L14 [Candidatus Odinarchaeia archaeon]
MPKGKKGGTKSAKAGGVKRARRRTGVILKPRVSPGLVTGSRLKCADNTGAKELELISVLRYKGRLNRMPRAGVGDMVVVSVKKGTPEMRRQVLNAIIIRQRKPYRRPTGEWVQFEDNAAVITSPIGEPKGSEIRGAVAQEAAGRWARLASAASTVV